MKIDIEKMINENLKNWSPRLLNTFGHCQTEEAAVKILDNCDENGCVPEDLFPNGRGLYDLRYGAVIKEGNKWRAGSEFFARIQERHPEEIKKLEERLKNEN